MSLTQRKTIRFMIPTELADVQSQAVNNRDVIPLYINPQQVVVTEAKLVKDELTKGGFMIQYWGEDLTRIDVSGVTGSGGIEAINILRDVYRNEITQFKKILLKRSYNFSQEMSAEFNNDSVASAVSGIVNLIDNISNNSATSIANGTLSIVDVLSQAFKGAAPDQPKQIELMPSLAAFALSVDMYFQGVKYRGYFTNFNYTENAQQPGLFEYSFNFKVLRKYGTRKNFMPWHRNPEDASGMARQASLPIEGVKSEELSVQYGQNIIAGNRNVTSKFPDSQLNNEPINNVGISRIDKVNK